MASDSAAKCAGDVLETIPLAMGFVRSYMREHPLPGISIAQFRTLAFLNFNENTTLSALAEHLGVSLPSMSRMIDGLLGRGLVTREILSGDRRKVSLGLTAQGQSLFSKVHRATQARLAEELAKVSPEELRIIRHGLVSLHQVLDPAGNMRHVWGK